MYKTNRLISLITILFLNLVIVGCVSMPLDYPKEPTTALTETADTYLAKKAHGGVMVSYKEMDSTR